MRVQDKILKLVIAPLIVMAMISCDNESDFEKRVKEDDYKVQKFLSENGLEAEKHFSGIYYEALETNSGGTKIKSGNVVSFYYNLTTLDSAYEEVIADSLSPVFVEHDYNRIIPAGLYSALGLMNKGEKYRFYVPSYLAFNEYGKADFFSPYSIFVVDIEVVDVLSKDTKYAQELDSINSYIDNNNIEDIQSFSSGLFYKSLQEGTGPNPSTNSIVEFNYTRTYLDGSGLVESDEEEPIKVRLNENNMIKGLVEGISKMKKGGRAMFIVPSKIGYGSSFVVLPEEIRSELIEDQQINASPLPFSPLMYEVELLDIR